MLNVILLKEKKPGHAHQVEGIARVLSTLQPANLVRVEVKPSWWADARIRGWFLRLIRVREKAGTRTLIRTLYDIDLEALPKADVVIASGRPATALGILLRQYFGARLIYSGYASGPRRREIDLQLVNAPGHGDGKIVEVTPLPGLIDAGQFRAPKKIAAREDLRGAEAALMIGGDSHPHRYVDAEWERIADFVKATHDTLGVRWRVSTSRRSPRYVADLMTALEANGAVAEFIDYQLTGPASGNDLFGADVLVVTEDSLSMLSEAMAAGRPVVSLKPARVRENDDTEIIAYQIAQGWIASVPIAELDVNSFVAAVLKPRAVVGATEMIRRALQRLDLPV
jgi:mitochondrial fission protein ELM1